MSVDKKATMKRIAELTKSESWQEDKEIVAEVQKLGKSMWTEKPKRKTPNVAKRNQFIARLSRALGRDQEMCPAFVEGFDYSHGPHALPAQCSHALKNETAAYRLKHPLKSNP